MCRGSSILIKDGRFRMVPAPTPIRFHLGTLIPTPIPTPLKNNYMAPIPVPIPAILTPIPVPIPYRLIYFILVKINSDSEITD